MNDDIYRPYYINQVDDYVGGLGTSQLQLTIEGRYKNNCINKELMLMITSKHRIIET